MDFQIDQIYYKNYNFAEIYNWNEVDYLKKMKYTWNLKWVELINERIYNNLRITGSEFYEVIIEFTFHWFSSWMSPDMRGLRTYIKSNKRIWIHNNNYDLLPPVSFYLEQEPFANI